MISIWAPLALTAATGSMLALPLSPALLEVWRRKDAGPIPTRKDDGNIRNFARSFRRYIAPLQRYLDSAVEQDAIMEARMGDGSYVLIVGKGGAYPLMEQQVETLILFGKEISLTDGLVFMKDVYSAAAVYGGRKNVFRALLGDNDIFLGDGTHVMRWIHGEKRVVIGRGGELHGRCSAEEAIYFSSGCRFQRVFAPMIVTANQAQPDVIPELRQSSSVTKAGRTLPRSRVQGNLHLGAGEIFFGNIIATGSVRIDEGTRIFGSAKGNGDVQLREQTQIDGSLVSTGTIHIGPNCAIKGPVLAEHEIIIGPGTRIGSPDSLTTISAPRIRIAPDCVTHGTLHARVEGRVEE
jgi:predicted acyltransferase (DUF342 family)